MSALNVSSELSLKGSQLSSGTLYSANREHFLNSASPYRSQRLQVRQLTNASPLQLKNKIIEQENEINHLNKQLD